MTSSMLAGERKWASSRRGGMTVLGKVAVPKPINLPSQKLENHGLDPNVEIVPKGSSSWGSRPSSSTSNPWGSSAVSPKADGTTVLPHHPSGRPTSSSGLSRPSTAGSDRHDPSATAWGSNSRPSSASGVLTSNQSSLTSSRPLSAETRPGSSHLSRFAEPVYDNNSVAWGPNGTADQSVPSRADGFSLSSGDFPTLGSEKDNTSKSGEPQDHDSHVRPGSGSGRHAPMKDRNEMAQADHRSGNVDTWTRDGSPRFNDGVGVRPNADNWHQGDSHQYVNPNLPQHYDAWPRPPMNAHPGVWYRGPPPAGSPYPHVPHGGFPMEPFPYYHPQPGPPPGPGPRGHHPRNGDFYRPQMPDAFIRPGAPYRPGFYHGPVPYDGYYAPPMGYNPNDHEMPFMGMPRGPHGPPVYNMCPPQNPSELNDPHFRGGVRGPVGNMFVSEQMDSIPPEESRGPYKVLRKHENEKNADMEEDSWEPNMEKNDHPKLSFQKNERGTDTRRNDPVILHSSQGPHRSRASSGSWGNKSSISEDSKDSTLIQKIEDLNAKARASDIRGDAEQTNKLLNNPKGNSTIAFGTIPTTGDHTNPYDRPAHHEVRNRADHLSKGRLSNQDSDGWRKTPPILGSEVAPENRISAETKVIGEPLTQMADPADGQAQRARMKELARQRAIELQKEEEERIREQKAKALAKLEELNRRTLGAADDTTAEKNSTSVSEQEDVIQVDRSQKPTEPASDKKAEVVTQISEDSQQVRVDRPLLSKQSDAESKASLGSDGGVNKQKRASHRQKQSLQVVGSSVDKSTPSGAGVELLKNSGSNVTVASHRQKQSLQVVDSSVDKSTFSGTGGEIIKNPGSNVNVSGEAVQSQESTLPNNSNTLSESTQHKKKNNKSSKNKHKLEASASREADLVKPDSQFDAKQSSLDQISSLPSNQYNKPQHARRMPRNPQANRVHGGDVAVWAPVRSQNKEVVVQDDVALPEKTINNSGQTNPKSKRAEMERYVPKPVAKELAHQGGVIQSTVEDKTDAQAIPVSSNVRPSMESKSGDNKQVKPHGAWGQRNQGFQQDSKKVFHKPTSQHEESNTVPTETGTVHEWDPSDGWFMPDGYPPTEITPVVKDEGGFAGKGKKQAYKGQRSTVKNQMQSGAEVEVDQTDRPASSKENRSSHWQPKPQAYKSGWSGGQNANPEVKREPVHDDHQDGRRERKPVSFRGRTHPPNQNQGFGNIEDEAQFEQQHHHVSSGFRKYGGQNNRSSGQDDNKSKHSYQPVGSNNNSNKSSHLDPPADGAPRYKDRGLGQSRRGGGEFYRRQ